MKKMFARGDSLWTVGVHLAGLAALALSPLSVRGEGASRGLPDKYSAGSTYSVSISIESPVDTSAVGLEETPPDGWSVSSISEEGLFDPTSGRLKWGPFFAPAVPPVVTYDVMPPVGDTGGRCFSGTVSFDGFNEAVTGKQCIASECGACQLHGDVHPFDLSDPNGNPVGNCSVDLDDILAVLGAFEAAPFRCPQYPHAVNLYPCGQACPDGVINIDDILSVLLAFSGSYSCPHPCPGGACCSAGPTCQDIDGASPGTTPVGGMSETTCRLAGGMYQGNGTPCADVRCP